MDHHYIKILLSLENLSSLKTVFNTQQISLSECFFCNGFYIDGFIREIFKSFQSLRTIRIDSGRMALNQMNLMSIRNKIFD